MELGNVSKGQQPDHRKNNSRRSLTGLQCSETFPHPEASFSWPLNKYKFSDNERHTNFRIVHKKLKLKKYKTNKGQRLLTWDRCKNAAG